MKIGAYVLATKYSDGDPQDHWAVGYYQGQTMHSPPRYDVVDGQGNLMRGNGFRKIKGISRKKGHLLVKLMGTEFNRYWYKSVWTLNRLTMKEIEDLVKLWVK